MGCHNIGRRDCWLICIYESVWKCNEGFLFLAVVVVVVVVVVMVMVMVMVVVIGEICL